MTMRAPRHILLLLLLPILAGLTSCHQTIHMHPWEEEVPVADARVLLTLHVDNSAPRLGAVIDYTVSPAVIIYADDLPASVTARAASDVPEARDALVLRAGSLADAFDEIAPYRPDGDRWELRLKYEVYAGTAAQVRSGNAPLVKRGGATWRADAHEPAHDVGLEVRPGAITVVAVADIVPAGTADDWFFNTSAGRGSLVSIMEKRQGEHDNVCRDCFVVGQEFVVEPPRYDGDVRHLTATLTRPQGRYMVIADDYETYLGMAGANLAGTMSHIQYPSYINVAYSALLRRPTESSFGFGYDFTPSLTHADGAPYVRLGDDWSFVNGDRSNFMVDITVREKDDGSVVSNNPGILVPVFPGRVTLVVGHWLTEKADESGDGGVSIDPDFSNEIIIRF